MSEDTASARKPEEAAVAARARDSRDDIELKPFRLEDLLSGLPPIEEEDEFSALARGALEPALQLSVEGDSPAAEAVTAPTAPARAPSLSVGLRRVTAARREQQAAATAKADQATPPTQAEEAPVPSLPPAVEPVDELSRRVEAIIAAHHKDGTPPAKGHAALPERREALELLLSEPPPANDFDALDALYACWPRATLQCGSRALLAVAHNVSRNYGLPGKVPMTASKAWRMLSPDIFQAELAQRLADVGAFIADWQQTQRTFLILEFNEVELIEYLFEALHPGDHADLLAGVMNFKVLSNRRLGLLRRIPTRVKKQVQPLLPGRKDEAMQILAHAKALLDRIADPSGFAPIVETAAKMAEEVEKIMGTVAAQGAPAVAPPGGGGLALGRSG